MCRNIKTLFNFEPPASEEEVRASALQFVRKLSGFNTPSQANAAAFDHAVDEVSAAARKFLASLHTHAPPPRGGRASRAYRRDRGGAEARCFSRRHRGSAPPERALTRPSPPSPR